MVEAASTVAVDVTVFVTVRVVETILFPLASPLTAAASNHIEKKFKREILEIISIIKCIPAGLGGALAGRPVPLTVGEALRAAAAENTLVAVTVVVLVMLVLLTGALVVV